MRESSHRLPSELEARLTIYTVTKGKYPHVYHFDSKAEIEKYIRSLGIGFTAFLPGFYMSNIPHMLMKPNPDSEKHELVFAFPVPIDASGIPLFEADADTGKFVKAILKKPDQSKGKRIFAATEYLTPKQMLDVFKQVKPNAGKDAKYVEVPPEQYKQQLLKSGMPEFAATELLENFLFMPEFGYFGGEDLEPSIAVSFLIFLHPVPQ